MRRFVITMALTLAFLAGASAQPGSVRTEIEASVTNAVEQQRIRSGHFYAKSSAEHRWVAAWFHDHPYLRLVASDDKPRWYDFGRHRPPHGFWFDITSGHDLGQLSKLDKNLAAAMRRALLNPIKAPLGLTGDSVLYCLVENEKYIPSNFDKWLESQCNILIPWSHRNEDGTLSLAFVTHEQEDDFRRKNHQDLYDRFREAGRRPLAAYLVDFDWYAKSNFLIETEGVTLGSNGFTTQGAESLTCLWVKNYDKLYLWENGFLHGIYPLTTEYSTILNNSWKEITKADNSRRLRRVDRDMIRTIRSLPLSEKERLALLDRYEDSLYSAHLASIAAKNQPDTLLLKNYFNIYGKYDSRHATDIETYLYTKSLDSIDWVIYYLKTYDRQRGRYYTQMDDIAFGIVQHDFALAQTYKNIFPLGKHLREADEIITLEKACRLYDRNLYLSKYPDGDYLSRFEQHMVSEEERLYNEARAIYSHTLRSDIETTMSFAVYPYMHNFPSGKHIEEINEMYYYGTAIRKRLISIYGSRYSLNTNRGSRLRRIINNTSEASTSKDEELLRKQATWIHRQVMAQSLSQYMDLKPLDGGGFELHALRVFLPQQKKKKRCTYEREMAQIIMFDRSKGTFYISDGSQRKYESDSPYLTLKMYLTEGYTENRGILYEAEQWLLDNCENLPTNP